MDAFALKQSLIQGYESYVRSFINIKDPQVEEVVDRAIHDGLLWPEPLIQLNPRFEPGQPIADLIREGVLHPDCAPIFRAKSPDRPQDPGRPLRLHKHQEEAIRAARRGRNYILTTGTGSGKSLAYIIPIVDLVRRQSSPPGIKAIIVYPMNALANSQRGELEKFLQIGFPAGHPAVTFARYTGQEKEDERRSIIANPPDILLTNYVMLELILTRPRDRGLVQSAQGLRFLVLDELHTYRGRQGADVALLLRRVRETLNPAGTMQCVGTSATLAGPGSREEQRRQVSEMATLIFGADVFPEDVIGETLRRATQPLDTKDPGQVAQLRQSLEPGSYPSDYASLVSHPLIRWIEGALGLDHDPENGTLIRRQPRGISGQEGAAEELAQITGASSARCQQAIREALLAGARGERDPETGFPVFAFRLHQFIGRGDTVYATLQPPAQRHLTLQGQSFAPGDEERRLFPLLFCRECGQDYYSIRWETDQDKRISRVFPRLPFERVEGEETQAGYLALNSDNLWVADASEIARRLPDDWVDQEGNPLRQYRDYHPRPLRVGLQGEISSAGTEVVIVPSPFRFCPRCGVTYSSRQKNDFGKLGSLASEGRSTATTILCLNLIEHLRREGDLPAEARKLLSFTDNRQDASLQAGHFNDFLEVGLLRTGIYRAAREAGETGLAFDQLADKVFSALNLPFLLYAVQPDAQYQARRQTENALRDVLGYRVYRDLKRGWRVTAPNLEQCGLLEVVYLELDQLCADPQLWADKHTALATADPPTRFFIARTLLDFMRRELAINVDYLNENWQNGLRQRSSQWLIAPWGLDENEVLEHAGTLYPRSRRPRDFGGDVFLSARGGFGQFLRRPGTFPQSSQRLTSSDVETIARQLLEILNIGGYVTRVQEPADGNDVPGYQVQAGSMRWASRPGTNPVRDPIRVPRLPEGGSRVNAFFVRLYQTLAGETATIQAREHTAQVPSEVRQIREERFRKAELPILFCSPTMELGVDIAELNVVNLRNVPPTPANYAQRSGRAGRGGQPALVVTYCTTGSGHDQYFFRRQERMVGGAVSPPRIDLANEDLIRAHVNALWLAESQLSLGSSLREVLKVDGPDPDLEIQEHVLAALNDQNARGRTLAKARRLLDPLEPLLREAGWYHPQWLEEVLNQVRRTFEDGCRRWRDLYRGALGMARAQDAIIRDASRPAADREAATRRRREAETQMDLLTDADEARSADFYSYRYFASEGFLPGYSFPRLPLAAFIPGRQRRAKDEFLQRPRFLAITEFGPRSIIYHEGSRYVINKITLPLDQTGIITQDIKTCPACGYLHLVHDNHGPDLCELCQQMLGDPLCSLLRLSNVSTKRRDRINSDEEERVRQGYEVRTKFRFAERGGRPDFRQAAVADAEGPLATLRYGQAATIWRINQGWRRRQNLNQFGFLLDIEQGFWARRQDDEADPDDPLGPRLQRVIPYVEDSRNALIFQPEDFHSSEWMASLGTALSSALAAYFQLEDGELSLELLPTPREPRLFLIYESAEGGAGVLRRLIDTPGELAAVARQALEICHFDPQSGTDQDRAPHSREDCQKACYDCLLNYANQPLHGQLDRHAIREILLRLGAAAVSVSDSPLARPEHLEQLLRQCDSALERNWLAFLEQRALHLPSEVQKLIEAAHTRADFYYQTGPAVVFIDGPAHEFPEHRRRDAQQTGQLEDLGYQVIRFPHDADWEAIVGQYPALFGQAREPREFAPPGEAVGQNLLLYPSAWRPVAASLAAEPGLTVEPGEDILHEDRIIGATVMRVVRGDRALVVIDAASIDAADLQALLRTRPERVLSMKADDPGAPQQILAALAD